MKKQTPKPSPVKQERDPAFAGLFLAIPAGLILLVIIKILGIIIKSYALAR